MTTPQSPQSPPPDPPKPVPMEPLTSELSLKPTAPGFPWLIGLVLVLTLLGLVCAGVLRITSSSTPQEQALELTKTAEKNAAFVESAQNRMVQIEWRKLQRQAEEATQNLAALTETLGTLGKRLSELARSDEGRRIAAAENLVVQFAAVARRPHPGSSQLQTWQADARDLSELFTTASQDPHLLVEPPEKAQQQAATLQQEVAQALQEARDDLSAIESLVQSAAKNQPAPASRTLAQAVETREQEREERRLAQFTKERDALREQADDQKKSQDLDAEKKLRAQELEQQRIENEMKITAAKAKTEREQAQLRETQEKLAAEKAHAEKLKQFEKALPEIRTMLSPMISKGKMQIGGSGWTPGEEGPVSLASLKRNKTLELTESGTFALSGLFCGPLCRNDRPRGGFPDSVSYNEAKIRRAQELLVEFGDILVEKKMLRP